MSAIGWKDSRDVAQPGVLRRYESDEKRIRLSQLGREPFFRAVKTCYEICLGRGPMLNRVHRVHRYWIGRDGGGRRCPAAQDSKKNDERAKRQIDTPVGGRNGDEVSLDDALMRCGSEALERFGLACG